MSNSACQLVSAEDFTLLSLCLNDLFNTGYHLRGYAVAEFLGVDNAGIVPTFVLSSA